MNTKHYPKGHPKGGQFAPKIYNNDIFSENNARDSSLDNCDVARHIMQLVGVNNPVYIQERKQIFNRSDGDSLCRISRITKRRFYKKIVLADDLSIDETAQVAWHEAYHVLADGRKTCEREAFQFEEESRASIVGTVMAKKMGFSPSRMSYAASVCRIVPLIKKEDESFSDLGERLLSERLNGGNSDWSKDYGRHKNTTWNTSCFIQYKSHINAHFDEYFEYLDRSSFRNNGIHLSKDLARKRLSQSFEKFESSNSNVDTYKDFVALEFIAIAMRETNKI